MLKAAIIVVPLVTSVVVSLAVASLLPRPGGLPADALWWACILASSLLVLIGGEAIARRTLPLVSLLRLSLLFPGSAPSRMDVARRSSRRELERLAEQVRRHGLGSDAEAAAATLVHLVAALDAHDRSTRGHSERVRTYADLLAHRLHLDEDQTNKLRWAALLHDIGKLSVPAEVLNKPGGLTPAEWDLIHRHPAEGDRMLGALGPWLGPWALVVLEHHERWDGTGYPAGLAGDAISSGARLVAVADCYDVMTSVRSYQPRARTPEAARDELVRCSGSQFDPGMVRCFLDISTRHLWWLLGPATWIVQIPFVGRAAAAMIRRPIPKLVDLGPALACGVAALTLTTGFGGPSAAPEGPVLRSRPAVELPASVPVVARRMSRRVPEARPVVRSRPVVAGRTTSTTPRSTVATRPPARAAGTAAQPVATAGSAGASGPAPGPAAPASPGVASTSTGRPVPSPVATAPATTPTGSGRDHGRACGYGHEKGKGKGHAHHDANGDGVDDKAGNCS